jgi:putative two-component system response regulator
MGIRADGQSGNGRSARVLIAEDDPSGRELLGALVEELGYEAVAVANGEAALEAIQANPPDIVLSDVNMPGMGGFEVCRRLKGNPATRLIPVILITGMGELHKAEGIEAGADDFLSKPFLLTELRVRMRSLMRMKGFTDELESAEAVLRTLAISIEAKDPYTEGHCERLADFAWALGEPLGANEELLEALQRGAYLHDLGKIGVPEQILLKPGLLTPEEREIIREHPITGERICRPLRSFRAVLPIIRHHHERWDGSGYPDGLAGDAIPLGARILQVVDVFDALTTNRPYRQALSRSEGLEVLEEETRGGWWDPRIVQAFRKVVTPLLSGEGGRTGGRAVLLNMLR